LEEYAVEYLQEQGLADDAPGRRQAVAMMFGNRENLEDNLYYNHFRCLAMQYDQHSASAIDPWFNTLVAGTPDMASQVFIAALVDADKLDGNAALLRAGVDLQVAAPDSKFHLYTDGVPSATMIDGSPLAAMICYLEPEGWAQLRSQQLLPRYAEPPYAGRIKQEDGTEITLNVIDFLQRTRCSVEQCLCILDVLDSDSAPIGAVLADEAIRMLKQRLAPGFDSAHNLTRTAMLIGSGADLVRLAEGIKDENECSLPSLLAAVQAPECKPLILKAFDAIARAAKDDRLAADLRPVFDFGFCADGGYTPLHMAAALGYPETVACYIAAGADVNVLDEDRATPLHEAAKHSGAATVEVLLGAGADIDAVTKDELTAEILAQNNGHHQSAQMIAAHRARRAVVDVINRGRSACVTPAST
jgi:hypothetical protein